MVATVVMNPTNVVQDGLNNKLDYRLCNVNLVDSHYCTDAGWLFHQMVFLIFLNNKNLNKQGTINIK